MNIESADGFEIGYKENIEWIEVIHKKYGVNCALNTARWYAIECLKESRYSDTEHYIDYIKELLAEREVEKHAE